MVEGTGDETGPPVCDGTARELLSGEGTAIPLFKVHMPPSVLELVGATLMSGYIGQGPKVDEFESALAPWFGNDNVLSVNAGTSALHLALRLADVGAGDDVVTTAMTCSATIEPILERGARVVWADVNPLTGNIDPLDVERKVTPDTKAIMAVHWGGYPCDLDELNRISRKYDVALIEDAAHAFGATYKDRPIGCHSDFVCFSFQAIKHLTTVDGGALTCRTSGTYKRGKLLRWFGIDREAERRDFRCEEDIKEHGYKFHMNDVNATIGLEQLQHVDRILERHRANAAHYDVELSGLSGAKLLERRSDRSSAHWLYTILVEDRADFMKQMSEAKITVSQVHSRNDKHTMMREFQRNLPGVDAFSEKNVSIPVGWWLSDEERTYIAETIRRVRE